MKHTNCIAEMQCVRASSFAEHDALDGRRVPRGGVASDQCCAHFGISLGCFKLAGHPGKETMQHHILFDADYAVVRAAHAHIRLVSGAAGKNALVGSGDVSVRAEHCGDAAVEVPTHGAFFAGGFSVEVDDDDFGL